MGKRLVVFSIFVATFAVPVDALMHALKAQHANDTVVAHSTGTMTRILY